MNGWARLLSSMIYETANKSLLLLTINQVGSGTLQKQLFPFNLLQGGLPIEYHPIFIVASAFEPRFNYNCMRFSKESRICACSIADTEIQKQRSPTTLLLPAAVIVFILFPLLSV
jgi:hypothetical protein